MRIISLERQVITSVDSIRWLALVCIFKFNGVCSFEKSSTVQLYIICRTRNTYLNMLNAMNKTKDSKVLIVF